MNPEDNNPLSNPFAADTSAANSSAPLPNANGAAMPDNLASAQDSLTAAGMAANQGSGTMSLEQIAESDPNATMLPPVEEPLVPAAPVPGSIGSAVSVPPADPVAAPAFGAMNEPAANAPITPDAVPPANPYNPFATPAAASTTPASPAPQPFATPTNLDTTSRPSPAPISLNHEHPKTKLSPLTLALGALAAILLVTTIVFLVLWIQARNNPKIVYTPAVSEESSNSAITTLSCHRNETRENPAGSGTTDVEIVYTDDTLSALSSLLSLSFASAEDANVARDADAGMVDMMAGLVGGTFSVSANTDGTNYAYSITSQDGVDIAPSDAMNVIYGTVEGEPSLALADVQAKYEADGFVCSEE